MQIKTKHYLGGWEIPEWNAECDQGINLPHCRGGEKDADLNFGSKWSL